MSTESPTTLTEATLPLAPRPSPLPALEVHDLTVSYHRKPVLWNVDLAIPPGQLVGIIGPNGAGKSTLIKAIMGLLPLSSGWVQVFGQPIDTQREIVGYSHVFTGWDYGYNGAFRTSIGAATRTARTS